MDALLHTMEEATELWGTYKQDGSFALRNRLFLYYAPWMKRTTMALFSRHRMPTTEWRDCVQTASVALLEAIGRYNQDLGVPFEGFAYPRLKGAVLNFIFKDVVTAKHSTSEVGAYLEELNESTYDEDNVSDFDSFLDSIINAAFSAFLDVVGQNGTSISKDPLDVYVAHSQEEKILLAVQRLDDGARYVIEAYYINFLSFVQIAESLKISKSRVSQLHVDALKKLRKLYESV